MTPATATFFPVRGCSCAQGPASSKGKNVRAYDIQAAIVPRTTCGVRPAARSYTYQNRRGCGTDVSSGADDYHAVSRPGDIIGAEGGDRLYQQLLLGIYLVPIEERLLLTSNCKLDGSIQQTPPWY